MTGGVLTILPILRPSPPVFAPPAARFKIERVLTAIRGKLLSPPAISVPIEIPMEGFNNFGIVQMGPDFSPVLRQIIITHSLVPRVLRLNHRQLRSCRFLGFLLLMYVRPQVVRQWDQDAKAKACKSLATYQSIRSVAGPVQPSFLCSGPRTRSRWDIRTGMWARA